MTRPVDELAERLGRSAEELKEVMHEEFIGWMNDVLDESEHSDRRKTLRLARVTAESESTNRKGTPR